MRDRGYPADDRNASLEALSVYHAHPLEGYRNTVDLPVGSASTEQLREALIRYRALFEDLTGLHDRRGPAGSARAARVNELAADDRVAADNGRIPENSDLTAQNRGVAAENTDRTADTPR